MRHPSASRVSGGSPLGTELHRARVGYVHAAHRASQRSMDSSDVWKEAMGNKWSQWIAPTQPAQRSAGWHDLRNKKCPEQGRFPNNTVLHRVQIKICSCFPAGARCPVLRLGANLHCSPTPYETADSIIQSLKHPVAQIPRGKKHTSGSARATTRRPAGARTEAGLAVGARTANILMI